MPSNRHAGRKAGCNANPPILPPNPPQPPPPSAAAANPPDVTYQWPLMDIINQAEKDSTLQIDAFAGVDPAMFSAKRQSLVATAYAEYRMLMVFRRPHPKMTMLGMRVLGVLAFTNWNPQVTDSTIAMLADLTPDEVSKGKKNLRMCGLVAIQRRGKGKGLNEYTIFMLPMLQISDPLEAWRPGTIRGRSTGRRPADVGERDVAESATSESSAPGDVAKSATSESSAPGDVAKSATSQPGKSGDVANLATPIYNRPREDRDEDDDSLEIKKNVVFFQNDESNHHHPTPVTVDVAESATLPPENPADVAESATSENPPGDTLAEVDALIATYQLPPVDILKDSGIPAAEYRPAIAIAISQPGVTPDDVRLAIEEGIPLSSGIRIFSRWLPTAAMREVEKRNQAESEKAQRHYANDRHSPLREYRQERERIAHRVDRESRRNHPIYKGIYNRGEKESEPQPAPEPQSAPEPQPPAMPPGDFYQWRAWIPKFRAAMRRGENPYDFPCPEGDPGDEIIRMIADYMAKWDRENPAGLPE